jgi:hypothetical protein
METVSAATSMTRADVEALLGSANLLDLGQRADEARRERHGNTVTYVTVFEVSGDVSEIPGAVREVRITSQPQSIEAAVASVAAAKAVAGDRALTGFSLESLIELAAAGNAALKDVAAQLASAGLESIAEVPIDLLADPVRSVSELLAGGLSAWRVTVQRATWTERLALLDKVSELQRATGAVKVFAPLPRVDDRTEPSTGFDDVRTIAAARLMCDVPRIQVDWPLYGPKLAQVALTYGADDIDGVPAVDTLGLGWRRAPMEDVERNIRAAGQEPQLRSGRP